MTRLRLVGVVAVAGLVGVIAGAVLRGGASPQPATRGPQHPAVPQDDERRSPPAQATGPGRGVAPEGGRASFARSETGAVAAAVSYATASQSWMYLTDDDVVEAVEAVVAPESRDELVARVVDDVRLLRDQLQEASGTVWFVVAPLATRLDAYSSSHAVVRVWVVQVLAADGVAIPQSGWQTLTLDLRWHDGGWRVAGVDEAEGPTPQLEAGLRPWAADLLDETLSGFVRVGVR